MKNQLITKILVDEIHNKDDDSKQLIRLLQIFTYTDTIFTPDKLKIQGYIDISKIDNTKLQYIDLFKTNEHGSYMLGGASYLTNHPIPKVVMTFYLTNLLGVSKTYHTIDMTYNELKEQFDY